ncbi:unnamed protein product [Ixodes pacificus]
MIRIGHLSDASHDPHGFSLCVCSVGSGPERLSPERGHQRNLCEDAILRSLTSWKRQSKRSCNALPKGGSIGAGKTRQIRDESVVSCRKSLPRRWTYLSPSD